MTTLPVSTTTMTSTSTSSTPPAVDASACAPSIATQLSRKLAVLTMVTMSLLFAATWWSTRSMIVAKNAEELAQHSAAIADILELEARAGGEPALRARLIADAAMRTDSCIELRHIDGRPFFVEPKGSRLTAGPHVKSVSFDVRADSLPDGVLKARYSVDFSRDHAMGTRWAALMALMTLGAGAVVLAGARWRVRRVLRPLEDLAAQTRAIAPDRLDQRLTLANPSVELLPWVAQFNALMGRLERAYSQLEAFNADVAHELRTPLATLTMQTELALSRERPVAELRDTLACSLEELQRMTSLVNDMLFLSRADHGAKARRGAAVSLASLARDVLEFHEAAVDEAGLAVVIDGDTTMPIDTPLVQRALSNLVANACRYASRGSTVTIHVVPTGPGSARLSVHNVGQPIDAKDLPRLFGRFYRGDESRCCEGEQHFGLGLAIVAAVARMHDGAPFARSAAGGTTIGFALAAP